MPERTASWAFSATVDDLRPDTDVEVAAAENTGTLIVDVGITEVSTGG